MANDQIRNGPALLEEKHDEALAKVISKPALPKFADPAWISATDPRRFDKPTLDSLRVPTNYPAGKEVARRNYDGARLMWVAAEAGVISAADMAKSMAREYARGRDEGKRDALDVARDAGHCEDCGARWCPRCQILDFEPNGPRCNALILLDALTAYHLPHPTAVQDPDATAHLVLVWDGLHVHFKDDSVVVNDERGPVLMPESGWVSDVLGAVAAFAKSTARPEPAKPHPHEARGPACAMTQKPERAK